MSVDKDKENGPTAIGSRAGELCECGHLLADHLPSRWGLICIETLDADADDDICPCVFMGEVAA